MNTASFLKLLGSLLTLLCLAMRMAHAGVASVSFDQANQLYEQGKFSDAIAAYTKLLERKDISPALYFNLGNACFKNGQTGQAIVYYRLAQRLAPRDPDIRANLRFARETVGASPPGLGRWERWLLVLTLNEMAMLGAVTLWIWFLILAAGQLRRAWAQNLRPYRIVSGIATVLVLVWVGVVWQTRIGSSSAVVITREAIVRYGPFEEAQRFYTARDGTELAVLDHKDSWLQVSDGSKRVGWLPSKDVFLLPRS